MSIPHDQDFYAWACEQAAFLRAGRLSELDLEHLAEEIDSMGASDRRELMSRLTVLLSHLLKWQYQPERRGTSWRLTIAEQRRSIERLLEDSPSLRQRIPEFLDSEYADARDSAMYETQLSKSVFPAQCPYTPEQVMAKDFWPD